MPNEANERGGNSKKSKGNVSIVATTRKQVGSVAVSSISEFASLVVTTILRFIYHWLKYFKSLRWVASLQAMTRLDFDVKLAFRLRVSTQFYRTCHSSQQ